MSSWIQRNVVQPVKDVVMQGITPSKLALSFASGATGGVFPIPGVTTPVTVVLAWLFGANLVVAGVMNLLLTPVNLATVVPFIWFGGYLVGAEPLSLSVQELVDGLRENLHGTLVKYGYQLLNGVLGWVVIAPFILGLCYFVMLPVTTILVDKLNQGDSQQQQQQQQQGNDRK